MTVYPRIVPEGVSGLKKNKSKRLKSSSQKIKVSGHEQHDSALANTVSRMQADNKKENKRISPKELRKMVRRQKTLAFPNYSGQEIDELVNQSLPVLMKAYYTGTQFQEPSPTPELKAIWKERNTERRRIVAANRLRRKADQPLSRADREWIEKSLR